MLRIFTFLFLLLAPLARELVVIAAVAPMGTTEVWWGKVFDDAVIFLPDPVKDSGQVLCAFCEGWENS